MPNPRRDAMLAALQMLYSCRSFLSALESSPPGLLIDLSAVIEQIEQVLSGWGEADQ